MSDEKTTDTKEPEVKKAEDFREESTKQRLKREAAEKIDAIKAKAKTDIEEVKYNLYLELREDNQKVIDSACKKVERKRMREIKKAEYAAREKQYTVGEEIFNSVSHGIGVGLAIAGLVLLIVKAVQRAPANMMGTYVTSVSLFGASMIILYLMSTLYHALTPYGAKKVFAIFDHCSIYLLIAGTYTPICLISLQGALGWSIYGVILGMAVIGITFYSIFGKKMRIVSVITYLVMGLMILGAFGPVKDALPTISLAFLISGGAAYVFGVIFYSMKNTKWAHCIWHLFVMAGTILHFFSVYYSF